MSAIPVPITIPITQDAAATIRKTLIGLVTQMRATAAGFDRIDDSDLTADADALREDANDIEELANIIDGTLLRDDERRVYITID